MFDCFFFFQAEDGIRDLIVTGVQTCALPISRPGAVVVAVHAHHVPAPARSADLLRRRASGHDRGRGQVECQGHPSRLTRTYVALRPLTYPTTATRLPHLGTRALQRTRLTSASPRATRWMFSAMTVARASIMPSVQPDTCGVIRTFGSV